jgi:hypothetical protein
VNTEVKTQFRDVYDEHMVRYTAAAVYVSGLHVLGQLRQLKLGHDKR